MKVVRQPDPKSKNYIKQMQLDSSRRLLIVRMKNSDMLFMQAMSNIFQTAIVERIPLKSSEYDSITQTQWLPELACYIEGTQLGYIKIKRLSNHGECVMRIQCQFADRVCLIHSQ